MLRLLTESTVVNYRGASTVQRRIIRYSKMKHGNLIHKKLKILINHSVASIGLSTSTTINLKYSLPTETILTAGTSTVSCELSGSFTVVQDVSLSNSASTVTSELASEATIKLYSKGKLWFCKNNKTVLTVQ